MDEQDFENCCYYNNWLRSIPFKSSRVNTSYLVLFLDCFAICLPFLTSSPSSLHLYHPKHSLLVCNSDMAMFQNCLHPVPWGGKRLLLKPKILLNKPGPAYRRLRTNRCSSAASGMQTSTRSPDHCIPATMGNLTVSASKYVHNLWI